MVVTIVVLLILAGTTISAVFSENGIIKKAQEAANRTKEVVEREKNELNTIYNELSSITEGISEIIVTQRREDSISVKVNTTEKNLTDYQFSLDNKDWSSEQQSNEYTFTNLEKAIIDENNYKNKRGNEYTIYAKAKNDKNEDILFNSIKVSTVVEVQADASRFLYENIENGIRIVGINPDKMKFTASDIKEFDEKIKKATLIPSYIENKPVTEIDINLILENINKISIGNDGYLWGETEKGKYFNGKRGMLNFEGNLAIFSYTPLSYWENVENIKFRFLSGNAYAEKETNYNESSNGIILDLKLMDTELVIPPTVNGIVDRKEKMKNNINNSKIKVQVSYSDNLDPDPDSEPELINRKMEFILSKENIETNNSPHITFLGRENTENIKNNNIFWNIIKKTENYNIEYIE